MQQSPPAGEQYEQALQAMLASFEKVGLGRDDIFAMDSSSTDIEANSLSIVEQMAAEPEDSRLIVLQIKSQNKE